MEDDVDRYNQTALEVVRDFGYAVNDLFTLVEQQGRERLLLDDGVHFIREGYEILGSRVAEVIRGYLGNFATNT